MKLTRSELTHATDKQLKEIEVRRSNNPGWLARAMASDFDPAKVELFHKARLKKKVKATQLPFTGDRNVESVKAKMDERAKLGFRKYGVTTEREDLSLLDWLRHAQMESMDQVIYLEAAIRKEEARLAAESKESFVGACRRVAEVNGEEFDKADAFLSRRNVESPEDFANNLFRENEGRLG